MTDPRIAVLRDQVLELAKLRADLFAADALVKEKEGAFYATIKADQDATARLAVEIATLDQSIRAAAVALYEVTGAIKPAPGVTIKLFETLAYQDAEALAWAKITGMALLPESLDRKTFEKIAKASKPEFVTVTQTPKATVATDLSALLLPPLPEAA